MKKRKPKVKLENVLTKQHKATAMWCLAQVRYLGANHARSEQYRAFISSKEYRNALVSLSRVDAHALDVFVHKLREMLA